jgi:hypothetical protein
MFEFYEYHARAICPDCNGSMSNFLAHYDSTDFGFFDIEKQHEYNGKKYSRISYRLLRCAGCGRGGFYKAHINNENGINGVIEEFFPLGISNIKLPKETPLDIIAEFRESELCASVSAWRGATALLRSTLEKILKKNGYGKGVLKDKIDQAAADSVITAIRQKKAHEEIRSLGNDIMHDEWRIVNEEEYEISHHYIQRIIEDFYDDRITIEKILKDKGRI